MRTIPEEAAGQRSSRPWRLLGGNVAVLGLTSLFTDISSEMVAAVLPLFLTVQLGMSATGFGLIDGLYQLATALVRVGGGRLGDRSGRHKEVATAGYAASTLSRAGLIGSALSGWPVLPFLLVDRVGKGVRTSSRDALLSLSVAPADLGTAFGIHRTLDTIGALLGPVLAFAVLTMAPGAFDAVFVVSLATGVVGVAVISMGAQPVAPHADPSPPPVGRVLAQPRVGRTAVAALLLTVPTVGDGFVYLILQREVGVDVRYFPLLFAGTAVAYLSLSTPCGRLADRRGAEPVLLAGYVPLILLYLVVLPRLGGVTVVLVTLLLMGIHYAATDGVLAALVSRVVDGPVRGTAIALVTTAVAFGRFLAAVGFGVLWDTLGVGGALRVVGLGLVVGLAVAARLLLTGGAGGPARESSGEVER